MSARWRAPAAAVAGFGAVGILFTLAYLVPDHLEYPLGWDSPFYVWRTAAVGVDGLERIGGVRAASPLVLHGLGTLLGQSALTMAALGPALFAASAGLAGAGLLRAGLGISAAWVPFAAIVLWLGFGHPGMVREQPDNVLNAAQVLAALAAAAVYVRSGRGWAAVAALLAGAGLAHWPFFVLALGVVVAAALTAGGERRRGLLGAAAAGAAVVGGAFLWRPPAAWTSPRLAALREILRDRFLRRAGDPHRAVALPAAAGGLWALGRLRAERATDPGLRFVVHALGAWLGLTAIGALAQAAGLPVAGLRLLNNLFPLTLLAATLVWWSASRLAGAAARAGVGVAALVVLLAVAVPFLSTGRSWYEPHAIREASTAGRWLERAGVGAVTFTIDAPRDPLVAERRRNTLLAGLPSEVVPRVRVRMRSAAEGWPSGPVVAIRTYDRRGYEALLAAGGLEISRAVAAAGVPAGVEPERSVPGPTPDRQTRNVALVLALGALALFAAGLGWSLALLPPDPVLRWCLAPALGCAATALIGLVWAAAGGSFTGPAGAGPLALAAAAGAGAAVVRVRREPAD